MGPSYGGGFRSGKNFEYEKVTPPKNLRDVPRYLKELFGGFFSRIIYIFKLVWNTGPWILFAMLLVSLFEGIMPVVLSLVGKDLLNNFQTITVSGDLSITGLKAVPAIVMVLLITLFVCRFLSRIISQISQAVTRIAGEKVVREVKIQIMNKARELDLASFDYPSFYEKLENDNREAGNRPISIINSTFTIVSTMISLISYIIILSAFIPYATLIIVVVSIPSAIINFIYRRKNFQYIRNRSLDRRQMNYYSDLLVDKNLAKEIKLFDLSDTLIDRYETVFTRYYKGLRKLILNETFWYLGVAILSSIVNYGLYIIIAVNVLNGKILIGDYSLYTGALSSISSYVASLIGVSATIYEGTLFIDNLMSFLKEKKTIVPSVKKAEKIKHSTPHTIELINVSFSYPQTERKVLDNINLKFRPGETVVLVGLNGAGKTTLIKLLTRLYDPTEGIILLDGKDIREYDVKDLYSMFGIIFQDYGKYAMSVSENIQFGDIKSPLNPEKITYAAKQSCADEFIEHLPNGYDTPLMRIFEKNGIELSGGQWQKLAISRAFYSDSDILILDEPTASLDALAEQEIFNQFDKLRQGKTTIFVSHRLSSATVASKIVVLEYGKVIEEGTHRELMSKHGKYYELFSIQANRYMEKDGSLNIGESCPPETKRHRPKNNDTESYPSELE